jgi:hypothetical protein
VVTKIKFPVYDAQTDGNVFSWLISTAEDFRKIRQRERYVELEKASAKPQVLDIPKVENQERKAVNPRPKSYRRAVSSRSSD